MTSHSYAQLREDFKDQSYELRSKTVVGRSVAEDASSLYDELLASLTDDESLDSPLLETIPIIVTEDDAGTWQTKWQKWYILMVFSCFNFIQSYAWMTFSAIPTELRQVDAPMKS